MGSLPFPHQNRLGSANPILPHPMRAIMLRNETHLVELCGNYAILKRGSLPKGFSHTPVSGGAVTTVGLGM